MNKFVKFIIFLSIILMILILFYENVRAETDWKLSTDFHKTVASDVGVVQSGAGLQWSLHRNSLYLYLSKDVHQVRFAGQGGPEIDLWSAGIGVQRTVGEYLTLSCDAGWYEPRFKEMGEPQEYMSSPFAEGLGRYLNAYLYPGIGGQIFYDQWDYYTLKYLGAIGGKLSLMFEYPIKERLTFNLIGGYRYLKLLENVQGRNWSNGDDWAATNYWTIRYDRDFSGWMIGGAITFKF